MAAATAAMAAKNAAKDVAKEGANVSISLTYGHSENQVTQTTASSTHSGSVLSANNINIAASGGGADSNLSIVGSELNAKQDIRLHADNAVKLVAVQDTESQHTKTSSMSASAGIAATVGTSGTSFGITGSVSASKGHEDGSGTTQLNTHVNAGDQLVISSGGDTVIQGAVAGGRQVIADVKGNLLLENLQDMAKFDSKSQSISVSGTVGFGASVSGSYSQTSIHNDYASVQEQTGIRAGDGGFQIKVGGNTDLKGAVISSTEAGKAESSLSTATLTTSDIANHAVSKGSSVGVSGGFSVAGEGTQDKHYTNVGGKGGATGGMPAIAAVSENDSSATRSGISGGTVVITDDAAQRALAGKGADDSIAGLNRDVTTGVDTSGKIANNLDKEAMQATMEVTKAFAQAAAFEIGEYAKSKLDDADNLERRALAETDPVKKEELLQESEQLRSNWKEDGAARIALHTAVGALAGGTNGALGAGAAALSTDTIAKKLSELDIPETLRDALTLGAGAAVGALVGGEAGANSAANEVANNYLKHKGEGIKKSEQEMLKIATAECLAAGAGSDACSTRSSLLQLSAMRDQVITAACSGGASADCSTAVRGATAEGYQVLFTKEGKASVVLTTDPMFSLPPDYRSGSFEQVAANSVKDGVILYGEGAILGRAIGAIAGAGRFLWQGAVDLISPVGRLTLKSSASGALDIGGNAVGASSIRSFSTYTGDELSGNFIGPLTQNSYANRIVGNVTAPIDFDGHILAAEIKANGNVVGGHSTASGNVQIIPGTASAPNAQGVYSARVQVADPLNAGQFLPKNNNGGVSTLFPDSWTANRVKVEVDAAYQNRTIVGNKWTGTTPSGVRVEGYVNPKTTVYPKF